MPPPVRTRFAPSPTGHLQLGNARTALFNALYAQAHGGHFMLRIEDTDRERSREECVTDLMEDLEWLGLAWDEGPGRTEGAGPWRQSERTVIHAEWLGRLEASAAVYPCFCSEQALAVARERAHAAGRPPRYPGTCARIPPAEAAARIAAGEPAALRFRVEREAVVFEDLLRGPQRIAGHEIGDFVIRRADGTCAFLFANAIDDALMGVTHVLRGEDHLANTPRQILLLDALDLTAPRYGHLPLVLGADGRPLSKRNGSRSLRELRVEGYLPLAVLNHLARIGHHLTDERLLSRAELVAGFSLDRIGTAPGRHDEMQLRHWQRLAVVTLDAPAMRAWIGEAALAPVPADRVLAFLTAVRDNVTLPAEVGAWGARLFADPVSCDAEALAAIREAGEAFFQSARSVVEETAEIDPRVFTQAVGARSGRRGRGLFMPLRAALTGVTHGPEIAAIMTLQGRERIGRRLVQAAQLAH